MKIAGLPNESDEVVLGAINHNYTVGSGARSILTSALVKSSGLTTFNTLNRFLRGSADNRLKCLGTKKNFL